jgi:quinol-cytochrome oxidoreductase complex cytochrome b subunit
MGPMWAIHDTGAVDDEEAGDGRERERDLLDPRGWLAATAVVLVLLAATGLWQSWHYRPTAVQAWDDILTLQTDPGIRPPDQAQGWVSDAHRGLAIVFVVVGAAFVATLFRWAWRKHGGDAVAVAVAVVAVGATALAPASGHDLVYDQLALWAVRVGADAGGVWMPAFDGQVRFVLAGGFEVAPGTYRGDVVAHVIAVPALLFAAVGVLALRLRRR